MVRHTSAAIGKLSFPYFECCYKFVNLLRREYAALVQGVVRYVIMPPVVVRRRL